jgi:hypothetical protein
MSARPHADRRITTVQGALRRLIAHMNVNVVEFDRALRVEDTDWLKANYVPRVQQALNDLHVLAKIVAEKGTDDDFERAAPVLQVGCRFMAHIADSIGRPDLKQGLIAFALDL